MVQKVRGRGGRPGPLPYMGQYTWPIQEYPAGRIHHRTRRAAPGGEFRGQSSIACWAWSLMNMGLNPGSVTNLLVDGMSHLTLSGLLVSRL